MNFSRKLSGPPYHPVNTNDQLNRLPHQGAVPHPHGELRPLLPYQTSIYWFWRNYNKSSMTRIPAYGASGRRLQAFNHRYLRVRCARTSFPRNTSPVYQFATMGSAGSVSGSMRSRSWKNSDSRSCARAVLRTTLVKNPEVSPMSSVVDPEFKTYPLEVMTSSLVADIGISEHYFQIFEQLELSPFSILLHCRK